MDDRGEGPEDAGGALRRAARALGAAGVDQPRLAAEILLGRVLGWDRAAVLSRPEQPLGPDELSRFNGLVCRRAAGEPLQYILGEQEFYGLSFLVTPAVLIPRPETELLVERALGLARAIDAPRLRFADAGTGSGCIAVAFARHEERAAGWAIDVSAPALEIARGNALRHGLGARVHCARGDLLSCVAPGARLDFVLSNPPYVAAEDAASLPSLVRDHEPPVALFAGAGGMEAYGRLVPQAAERLAPGGHLLVELGAGQAERVAALAAGSGLAVLSIENDLQAIPRCLVARKGRASPQLAR